MLIYLTELLLDDIRQNQGVVAAGIERPLENLALCWREGKHIITGDRAVLEHLARSDILSSQAAASYKQVLSRLSEYQALAGVVATRVDIIGTAAQPTVYLNDRVRVLSVPPQFFADSASIQEPILLAENIKDARLLEQMITLAAQREGLDRLHFRCTPQGGGGSTLGHEYTAIQSRDERFCFAVADSDRKVPGSSLGPTAKALGTANLSEFVRTDFYILPCRTIENLIPLEVLDLTNQRGTATCSLLEDLTADRDFELRAHLDLKRPFFLHQVFADRDDSTIWAFWNPRLNYISSKCGARKSCISTCRCGNLEACQCRLYEGFGGKLLAEVLDSLDSMSAEDFRRIADPFLDKGFSELGRALIAWCCALPAHRT